MFKIKKIGVFIALFGGTFSVVIMNNFFPNLSPVAFIATFSLIISIGIGIAFVEENTENDKLREELNLNTTKSKD